MSRRCVGYAKRKKDRCSVDLLADADSGAWVDATTGRAGQSVEGPPRCGYHAENTDPPGWSGKVLAANDEGNAGGGPPPAAPDAPPTPAAAPDAPPTAAPEPVKAAAPEPEAEPSVLRIEGVKEYKPEADAGPVPLAGQDEAASVEDLLRGIGVDPAPEPDQSARQSAPGPESQEPVTVSRVEAGPWSKTEAAEIVQALLDGPVERRYGAPLRPGEANVLGGAVSKALNAWLPQVDPNNPAGALVVAVVTVLGPKEAALRLRRGREIEEAPAAEEEQRPEKRPPPRGEEATAPEGAFT